MNIVNGVVIGRSSETRFTVKISDSAGDRNINAQTMGKLVKRRVRIILGDIVQIQLDEYDVGKGFIVARVS